MPLFSNYMLKALLAMTAVVRCAYANPHPYPLVQNGVFEDSSSGYHPRFPDARLSSPEKVITGDHVRVKASDLPISYGRCYRLSSSCHGELGGDGDKWNYLKFCSGNTRRRFKVCHSTNTCQRQDTDSQTVKENGKFYLWDVDGSTVEPGGNYIVARQPGLLYTGKPPYENYVQFQGSSDCDIDNWGRISHCHIRLRSNSQPNGNNGFFIKSDGYFSTIGGEQPISLKFQEVECNDGH
ncbi:uncharacterized protein ATNIH1004_007057 [Aspergillus tanneri]|uniref:Uncharacterized protein n=1 Tax=Aspergillus tanneri TaxID=1220188 RepID=A0A5M9MF81_9EURO|nr:uncharacterized protein ATNIH1004_007057 [Aspergillus tanneri]KAA8645638.1 hypothetical protein ATNIH1004_007057 [Aspergillus tanneri]